MSEFTCPVVTLDAVETHPNADRLDIAHVGGYRCVIARDSFKTGDRAVYIPEQALVPEALLEEMGLAGRLAGKQRNRVKATSLRGVLSQGLLYPATAGTLPGDDMAERLGVTKYEPPIPVELAGEVYAADLRFPFDVEDIKKHPDVFREGEEVFITEKIHGTFVCFAVVPQRMADERHFAQRVAFSSKGQAAKGLWLTGATNTVYLRAATRYDLFARLYDEFTEAADSLDEPVFVCGEVFGPGVQDLHYGDEIDLRLFGVWFGRDRPIPYAVMEFLLRRLEVPGVPLLYQGPYYDAVVQTFTDGYETVSGELRHIREGCVISSAEGNKQLKSISAAYLLRDNATEYN